MAHYSPLVVIFVNCMADEKGILLSTQRVHLVKQAWAHLKKKKNLGGGGKMEIVRCKRLILCLRIT